MWREKDPILRMQRWLQKKKWWSEDEEKQLQESLRKEVLETMKRAQKRSPPPLESLITDVYDQVPPALNAQFEKLKTHIRKYPEAYPKSANDAAITSKGGA